MPRTVLPDSRRSPRFAGVSTFCRYPLLEQVLPENLPLDWAIYGVPYDGGVTYRPGARFGPRAVREESQYVKPYHIEFDVNVCEVLSIADAGDAPVRPYSPRENADEVCAFAVGLCKASESAKKAASKVKSDGAITRLMAVGGDHSIAYANIRATWERLDKPKKGLPLIHFDSHLDTVDSVWGERWGHASPFIRAIEDGIVDPRRMISIGVKGPLNTAADLQFAKEHGVEVVTYDRWRREGVKPIAAFLKRLGRAGAYVTFDIDCVDPAFAPGTGTPSVGGFTSAEVLGLLRALRGTSVLGADVVEVLPDRDPCGITALLAAHVMFEILALDADSRR